MKGTTTLLVYLFISCPCFSQLLKSWDTLTIALPSAFSKSVQISALAWSGDTLYLPSEKCGTIFIGQLEGTTFKYRKVDLETKRQTEGMAYHKGHFYLSDDAAAEVYKYNSIFDLGVTYPIQFRPTDEMINKDNGFEGIAVINDSTFYLLLEKDKTGKFAALYKGMQRGNSIVIVDKKLLLLEPKSRYSDLLFRDGVLYLLKSTYYGNNCHRDNRYELKQLKLNQEMDILKTEKIIETDHLFSLSEIVHHKCDTFNSNVEGITLDDKGNFYIVTDNFFGSACNVPGEKQTLLLRLSLK